MQEAAASNSIVQPSTLGSPPGYTAERCFAGGSEPSVCIYRRPGDCRSVNKEAEINRRLIAWKR
jgi:hypothetical protein